MSRVIPLPVDTADTVAPVVPAPDSSINNPLPGGKAALLSAVSDLPLTAG